MRKIYAVAGSSGYTHLSHSTGPDWLKKENYIGTVKDQYVPIFLAFPEARDMESLQKAIRLAEDLEESCH